MLGLNKVEFYLIALVVLGLLFVGAEFHGRHHQKEVDEQKAELALEKAKEEVHQREADARQISEDHDRAHQVKVDELQTRVDSLLSHPSAGIRLCEPASSPATPSVPNAAFQANEAPAGNGPALRSGPDISAAVVQFAAKCEADRQTVIDLQSWITDQAAKWEAEKH